MIIQPLITTKDIAARFGCSVPVIARLIRDRRVAVVNGVVDPSVIVIYSERLRAVASGGR